MPVRCLICALLICQCAFSQHRYWVQEPAPERFEGDSIISYLDIGATVVDKGIGGTGSILSLNFIKFEYYAAHYPIDTLLKFTDKQYAISLRVYSFWALLRRGYDSIENIAVPFFSDTAHFRFYSGDMIDFYQTGEFTFELLAGYLDRKCTPLSKERLQAIKRKYPLLLAKYNLW